MLCYTVDDRQWKQMHSCVLPRDPFKEIKRYRRWRHHPLRLSHGWSLYLIKNVVGLIQIQSKLSGSAVAAWTDANMQCTKLTTVFGPPNCDTSRALAFGCQPSNLFAKSRLSDRKARLQTKALQHTKRLNLRAFRAQRRSEHRLNVNYASFKEGGAEPTTLAAEDEALAEWVAILFGADQSCIWDKFFHWPGSCIITCMTVRSKEDLKHRKRNQLLQTLWQSWSNCLNFLSHVRLKNEGLILLGKKLFLHIGYSGHEHLHCCASSKATSFGANLEWTQGHCFLILNYWSQWHNFLCASGCTFTDLLTFVWTWHPAHSKLKFSWSPCFSHHILAKPNWPVYVHQIQVTFWILSAPISLKLSQRTTLQVTMEMGPVRQCFANLHTLFCLAFIGTTSCLTVNKIFGAAILCWLSMPYNLHWRSQRVDKQGKSYRSFQNIIITKGGAMLSSAQSGIAWRLFKVLFIHGSVPSQAKRLTLCNLWSHETTMASSQRLVLIHFFMLNVFMF